MPLMRFICNDCQEQFLRFSRLGKEHMAGICPGCKSANIMLEKFSTPAPAAKSGGPVSCDISNRDR